MLKWVQIKYKIIYTEITEKSGIFLNKDAHSLYRDI